MSPEVIVVWDEGLAERELTTADTPEVLGLIDALDGGERTLVTVYQGDAHAAAGGSAVSGLVVYVTFEGTAFHQLKSAVAHSDDEVTVVAGGQAGNFPRRLVVSAAAAKAALRAFVEQQALDPDQQWETS